MKIQVRAIESSDQLACCELLNEIIEIGGTTAYETPLTLEQFEEAFVSGEACLSCFVALDEKNAVQGFQCLLKHTDLPNDWGNIATFAKPKCQARGIGAQLFDQTLAYARQLNCTHINATIRADNVPGLRYYNKMGESTRNRVGQSE